jgi:hypothetical protein
MNEKQAYEAYGIRAEDGHSFTVEILGYQTEDEALGLAEHYAALWNSVVDLYRVPFIDTSSTPWATDEMHYVCRVRPKAAPF